jgi:hypothetical protein
LGNSGWKTWNRGRPKRVPDTFSSSLGSNEHSSYTQTFFVYVLDLRYDLTTTVSISLGNFNGNPEDNVTITTP